MLQCHSDHLYHTVKPPALAYFCCLFLLLNGCVFGPGHEINEDDALSSSINTYYDQAYKWRDQAVTDSAFYYFSLAKEQFLGVADSLGAGKCMINMALIMIYRNDYYGAQEVSLEATKYLDQEDPAHHHYVATNFNNIGDASLQLKDYGNAIRFFEKAILLASDSTEKRIYMNNIAKTYQEMGKYQEALAIYNQILDQVNNHPVEYARILTNRAVTQSKMNTVNTDVMKDLWNALAIRQLEKDRWGLNSSYYHLADIYQNTNPDSAYYYAHEMYEVAHQLRSPDDRLYALERLIQSGPPSRIRSYFSEFHTLQDSIRLVRESAKNQFAVIRYEVEKSKAEAVSLQQENERKNFQLWIQRLVILVIVVFGVLAVFLTYYWYRRRQQRVQLEAENQIKTHQLQTSKKIHDVVANGLYRVMSEIEYIPEINREALLDKLETMYEKSRDISHEAAPVVIPVNGFHQELKALVESFYAPDIKIILAGSDDTLWKGVGVIRQEELKVVVQELLVNMKKHSGAAIVLFKFERSSKGVHIAYTDNGKGFPAGFIPGKGLQNTENRIISMGGAIKFGKNEDQGAHIEIFIPFD